MSIRPTKRVPGLAFGVLALFAVGTNVQAGWVLGVAAVLGGILLTGLVLPLRALHGIEVERLAPRTATAGRSTEVTLRVTNTGRRLRGLILVEDRFCGTGTGVVGVLLPGHTRELVGHRTPPRRGVYRAGPCVLSSGAPFGVLRVRRVVEVPSITVVHPAVFDASSRRADGAVIVGPTGEVSAVRDYRSGDPMRHVHWPSSARRGQLVVRELEAAARGALSVVAEAPHGVLGDAVASVACSLALGGLREGLDVHLDPDPGGQAGPSTVLEWGARLEPTPDPHRHAPPEGGHLLCVVADPVRARTLEAGGAEVVLVGPAGSGFGGRTVSVDEVEAFCRGEASW